jgi:hypothetical protein
MQMILDHLSAIVSFVLGLAAGGTIGSILTLKISRVNNADRIVNQNRAKAGGDIVGGDKTHR